MTTLVYAPGRELVLFLVVLLVPSCSYSSFDHLMKGVLIVAKNHIGMEGKQIGFYSLVSYSAIIITE